MTIARPRGYDDIKALKKLVKCNVTDLLVLSNANDPFYCGQPAQVAQAEWFADLWHRFGYTTAAHLRRVHYDIVSSDGILRHDGLPYENTEKCWELLTAAAKFARHLGLVDADKFVDRRNNAPIVNFYSVPLEDPDVDFNSDELDMMTLPRIKFDLSADLSLSVPGMNVYGYNYDAGLQPYLVEVWAEKTTMNDVLEPVCRRHGVNLVTSSGFQSVTSAVELLQRAQDTGKPARIFYISDFDPAGDTMPVSTARHLEFMIDTYAPGADIKLQPLVLTLDQVREYNLPPIPIKESDKRSDNFMERYGVAGATELDALESRHPGALAQIVESAILPYRDKRLSMKMMEARNEARHAVDDQWESDTEDEAADLEDIEAEARQIVDKYADRLRALSDELNTELAPLAQRLKIVRQAIQKRADEFVVDLPDVPEAEAPGTDESGYLFDAARDYLAQLEVYRQRKNGEFTS